MATKNFGLVRVVPDALISETEMNANNSLSIEFFPPKTPEGAEKLRAVRQALYPLKPQFVRSHTAQADQPKLARFQP